MSVNNCWISTGLQNKDSVQKNTISSQTFRCVFISRPHDNDEWTQASVNALHIRKIWNRNAVIFVWTFRVTLRNITSSCLFTFSFVFKLNIRNVKNTSYCKNHSSCSVWCCSLFVLFFWKVSSILPSLFPSFLPSFLCLLEAVPCKYPSTLVLSFFDSVHESLRITYRCCKSWRANWRSRTAPRMSLLWGPDPRKCTLSELHFLSSPAPGMNRPLAFCLKCSTPTRCKPGLRRAKFQKQCLDTSESFGRKEIQDKK